MASVASGRSASFARRRANQAGTVDHSSRLDHRASSSPLRLHRRVPFKVFTTFAVPVDTPEGNREIGDASSLRATDPLHPYCLDLLFSRVGQRKKAVRWFRHRTASFALAMRSHGWPTVKRYPTESLVNQLTQISLFLLPPFVYD